MIGFFEPSFQLLLISLALWLIMIIVAKPYRAFVNVQFSVKKVSNRQFVFFFLIYASYIIFAFNSEDFFSYLKGFSYSGRFINYNTQDFEQIYNWFADLTGNYIVWRSVIWGLSVLFLCFTASKLELDNRLFLLSMVLFGLGLDVYTRGILGHTMLLLGAVLLIDKKSSRLTKFIGLALFIVSYFFHKSMYVNIAFAVLAFLPIFSQRKVIIASLIAFPFLTTAATFLIDGIASGGIDMSLLGEGVGGIGDRAELYATGEKADVTFMGMIGKIIQYTPEYLTLAYLTDRVVFNRYFKGIKKEKVFTYLYKLTYIAIYIASLFAFVETSSWIYIRFKYMAFFPLPFVLAKVWSLEERSNKWIKAIIILQIFAFVWAMTYKLNKWYGM